MSTIAYSQLVAQNRKLFEQMLMEDSSAIDTDKIKSQVNEYVRDHQSEISEYAKRLKSETSDEQNLKNIINKYALMKADILMSVFGRKNHEMKDVKITPGMRMIAMVTMVIFDTAIERLLEVAVNTISNAVYTVFNNAFNIKNQNTKKTLETLSKTPGAIVKSVVASFNYVTTTAAFEAVGLHKMLVYALYNVFATIGTFMKIGTGIGKIAAGGAKDVVSKVSGGAVNGGDILKLTGVLTLALVIMKTMTRKMIQEGRTQEAFLINTFGMGFAVLLINLNKRTA